MSILCQFAGNLKKNTVQSYQNYVGGKVTWVFKRSVIAMFQVALVFALTIGLALCLALAALVVILNLVILAL